MNKYRWLTKVSKQFLERDYLIDGQTVDERVNVIVDNAEKVLNKPDFAKEFKENLQKGWYSLSSPIWTNFGNSRGLPISCVVGETWINTKINGGKQAKDIVIGDEVLTHTGRYRKVTNVIVTKQKDDIYKLKINNRMTNLYLTGNHLVLTNLGWIRVDTLNPKLHLVAINRMIEIEEKSYKIDLRLFCDYDYLEKYKRILKKGAETVRKDRQVEIVSYYAAPYVNVELDSEVAWALGLWFAEGSISTNNEKPNGARVTVNTEDEKQYGDKWLKIMCEKFGINGGTYSSSVERNGKINKWYNVNVNSVIIGNFFASFGPGCKEKLIPDWLISAPNMILESFLSGLLKGDGTIRKDGSNKLTLSNPKLILQIYQIALKLGLDVSLQMQEKAGELATTKYVYTIRFRSSKLSVGQFTNNAAIPFKDGLYYATIRTLQKTNKTKTVYDFTVEEDHSFSAAGVILHNCYGSTICDSMESILLTQAEIGMMTKNGGGTSAYFGNLRGRGEKITGNGESSGSVHFMQLFDKEINVISQGSSRRGQFAAYLPIDHKDIDEFLSIRSEGNLLQDISSGVCVPDYWMQEMIEGDRKKRKTWARVLESRANTGYPYIIFIDNFNKGTVDVYKDKKMKITHSNLCVTGDQRVVSNRGLKTAKQLYKEGGKLELFDNNTVVSASEMKLIEKNVDVYKIILDNGMSHTVTNYHKVKIRASRMKNHYETTDVQCCDLKIGDLVAIQTNKGLFGDKDHQNKAFLLGLYHGDGTQTKTTVCIDLWEHDFDLLDEVQEKFSNVCAVNNTQRTMNNKVRKTPSFHNCNTGMSQVKKKRLSNTALKKLGFKKNCIPNWLWESNEATHWAYIRGLFIADGTVNVSEKTKGQPIYLSVCNINKLFLQKVQIILANLGMQTSLRIAMKKGEMLLPDGRGGRKLYKTKTCWRLIIGNKNDALIFNKNTSFLSRKDNLVEDREYRDNTKKFYAVKNIKKLNKKQDVYCCQVNSDNHYWVCNGVITHNCTEIALCDTEDESFVCDLSSMNILYYDEWKNTNAVELLVYFLDAVMTEFIDKAKKIKFMERAVCFAERQRALGIGWLGWHSYLQSRMIPFESIEAKFLNVEVAKNIKESTYKASQKLAEEYGEPELLKGYGRRNTTLLAIAPTKSSAFILGQVSEGIEPHRTNYYIKDLQKGKFTIINSCLENLLIEKGKNTDEVLTSILKNGGSVQHLEFLSQHEKDVFKTFCEINPKEIIIQASQRQKYIDQAQSLNLMIHPSIPIKDVNALIIEAWKLGVKSLYYQISVNAAQAFSRDVLSCKSCES